MYTMYNELIVKLYINEKNDILLKNILKFILIVKRHKINVLFFVYTNK